MYSYTPSLTSALDRVGVQSHASDALPRGKPCTHCTGGWVGPRAVSNCAKNIVPTKRVTDLKCMLLSSIYYVKQQLHDRHVGVTLI
jgi:hypothetical protein